MEQRKYKKKNKEIPRKQTNLGFFLFLFDLQKIFHLNIKVFCYLHHQVGCVWPYFAIEQVFELGG